MKKVLMVVVVMALLAFVGYYAYNQYASLMSDDFSDAQAKLYVVGSRQISEMDLTDEQVNQSDLGLYYLSLEDLEQSFNIVGDYDSVLDFLRLFKNGHRIEIDSARGITWIDDSSFNAHPLIIEDNQVYVPLNGLEEALGLTIVSNLAVHSYMVVEENSGYGLIESYAQAVFFKDENLTVRRYSKPDGGLIPISESSASIKCISGALIPYFLELSHKESIVYKPVHDYGGVPSLKFRNGEPIILFWEYVGSRHPNTETIPDLKGANISSPTWLILSNGEGDIQLNYSDTYVKWAEGRGIEVWPLITNDFNPDMTSLLLNSMTARNRFIDQLIAFLVDNDLKGVNMDFENMHLRDQDQYTQLIAELVYVAHKKGIIVSADVTVPDGSDNWSKVYDREKLSQHLDYMMVMTYDQHWASSPVSGTVSGITWMRQNVAKIMAVVPKEKLILGVPLYTRIWTEKISTTEPNKMVTQSKAITMVRAQEIIAEKKLKPIWDPVNGQYFVSYFEGDTLVKIWVEDLKSLALKAALVNEMNLAGLACWRRGFESEGTWQVISEAVIQ